MVRLMIDTSNIKVKAMKIHKSNNVLKRLDDLIYNMSDDLISSGTWKFI